jgi:hypothetical protein
MNFLYTQKTKMTKKIVLSFTLLVTGLLGFSQENTSSPYSYYGLGDVRFRGTHDARAMGGLNITGDSIALNLQNPASYSRLHLTTFAVGGSTNFNNLNNDTTTEQAQRTSLDYLAVGVPMGKFGASFGLIPYSAVGYKINFRTTDENNILRNRQLLGDGNVNNFYVGGAYSFNKNLSFGINIEYNFGIINNVSKQTLFDLNSNTIVQLGTKEDNSYKISGVSYNLGVLFNKKIENNLNLYSSLSYRPEAKFKTNKTRNLSLIAFDNAGNEFQVTEPVEIEIPDEDIVLPSKLSLGFGVGKTNKWMVGSEIIFLNSSNQNNLFTENSNSTYKNSQRYIVGGYYIPKYDSFNSYLSRVVYRAGFRYDATGLVINNQSINDYGMNFGLGLPLGVSKIDVGFEFGKRGTISNGLIQENYFNLSIGLSLSDKWFRKTLID